MTTKPKERMMTLTGTDPGQTLAGSLARNERTEAIAATVERERGRLFRFIRDRVSREEDAEDVLQDVFYQLVAGYSDIRSLEKMSSWLFTVARNKITDLYRKKKPVPVSEQMGPKGYEEEDGPLGLDEILPDFSSHPDQLMARDLIWNALEEALDELPEEQRSVFVQHEFENKSFKEIAEEEGVSINTMLSRKRYSILFLRKRLEQIYNEL